METEQLDQNDFKAQPAKTDEGDFTKYTVNVTTKYMCRYCAQQFDSTESMQQHLVSHNTGKAPYSCFACGKTYNTPSKLKRHVRVHSGEKPYPCSVCGRKFSRSDHVKQHMKVHLPERLRFFCRICKARFFRTQMLQSHLRMQHGIHNVFSCLTCGEAFQTMAHLINHKKSHPSDQDLLTVETDEGLHVNIKQEPVEGDVPVFGVAKFAVAGNEQAVDDIKIEEPSGLDVADFIKQEVDQGDACTNTEDMDFLDNDDDDVSSIESEPIMSVSACFSLANETSVDATTGHSETVTDGNKMFLVPSTLEEEHAKLVEKKDQDSSKLINGDKQTATSDSNIVKEEELPVPSTDSKPASALQRQDVIAKQKTQVVLSTPKLPIRSRKLLPTGPYNQDRFVRVSAVPASVTPSQRAFNMPQTRSLLTHNTYPQPNVAGRKLLRCEHCCIWFEDLSMYMLHSSLHSADETDPFTCKKCLKKLGNRLEFMAHLVWHLEPCM